MTRAHVNPVPCGAGWVAFVRRTAVPGTRSLLGRCPDAQISFRTPFDVYASQPYLAEGSRFIIEDLGIRAFSRANLRRGSGRQGSPPPPQIPPYSASLATRGGSSQMLYSLRPDTDLLDVARAMMGEPSSMYCRTFRRNPRIKGEDVATMVLGFDGAPRLSPAGVPLEASCSCPLSRRQPGAATVLLVLTSALRGVCLADGATCVVDCSYGSSQAPDPFPQTSVRVEGSDGTIELARHGFQLSVYRGDKPASQRTVSPAPRDFHTAPVEAIQDSVYNCQSHWLDCLRSDTWPAATSGRDNLNTLALVDAAYDSAARQDVVPLHMPS